MTLGQALYALYPNADPLTDYQVVDTGTGQELRYWSDELGPRPTQEQIDSAPAPRRRVRKSTIISRITDAQLDQALSLMSNRQRELWRSSDLPEVYVDDPEVLAILQAIGADAQAVLAP